MAENTEVSSPTANRESNLENKLATYKQKLKILKNAYIEEQSEKEGLQKQLISSYNTIDKLQKDLDEKEQKYLKAYKENEELHSSLIEKRSYEGRGHKGSVMVTSNNMQDLSGYKQKASDDFSPRKNGSSADADVLKLKVSQLEKKIEEFKEQNDGLEQSIYDKKGQISELKTKLQENIKDNAREVYELKLEIEELKSEREGQKVRLEDKLNQIEQEKQQFLEEQEKKTEDKKAEMEAQVNEIQDRLNAEIKLLEEEGHKRTDDFLKSSVKMDELREELVISRENETKLENDNQ
jgi:predicted  nucleic acid-binding Zn-ribbon protein